MVAFGDLKEGTELLKVVGEVRNQLLQLCGLYII